MKKGSALEVLSKEQILDSGEVKSIRLKTTSLIKKAEACRISTESSLEGASFDLQRIIELKRSIEKGRMFFTKPLNDHIRNINNLFRQLSSPLLGPESILKVKIREFRAKKEEKQREKEAALQKKAEKEHKKEEKKAERNGDEAPIFIAPKVKGLDKTIGGVTARKVWVYEMINESLIPREYLMINTGAIYRAVQRGVRVIPGTRIYQQESIQVKSR